MAAPSDACGAADVTTATGSAAAALDEDEDDAIIGISDVPNVEPDETPSADEAEKSQPPKASTMTSLTSGLPAKSIQHIMKRS